MNTKPKLFEIWCEGDPIRDLTACHLGYGKGKTLKDACTDLANRERTDQDTGEPSFYFRNHYNPNTMEYKGCRIFDNYQDAADSFN